jgi:hypothetical protein
MIIKSLKSLTRPTKRKLLLLAVLLLAVLTFVA